MVSSGGGLGRVRLTLRSSELCCRAASWVDGERETGGRRIEGGKQGGIWKERCMERVLGA